MSSSAPAAVRTRLAPARGLAGAAVQRARLTVVPRRRTRAPKVPFVTLVSLLMLAGVVGLLLFNTSMQQAAFTTTALQEQAGTLAAREQSLEMDLERLRDPERLAAAAQRAGMVCAGAPQFLDLASGRVLGAASDSTCSPLDLSADVPRRPASLDPEPILAPGAATTDGGRQVRDPARGAGALR